MSTLREGDGGDEVYENTFTASTWSSTTTTTTIKSSGSPPSSSPERHDAVAEPYTIFNPSIRTFIVIAVTFSSLISPFGLMTYFPSLHIIAADLNVTNTQMNMSLTTYMIAQALAPAFIGSISDSNGRRLSYIVCFILFLVSNIGLALQTNYAALLVLRILQAFGCSAALSLTNAVIADVVTSAERGSYVGYGGLGMSVGWALGPMIGGLLAQHLGWRSTFWFLAIFSGVLLVIFTIFFPETCRSVVGNGSIPAKGVERSVVGQWQQKRYAVTGEEWEVQRKPKFPNPLKTLKILTEKESGILLIYNGAFYSGMIITLATIPTQYSKVYGLDTGAIGLCYLPNGVGSMVAILIMGRLTDWNFLRHARLSKIPISKTKQQDLSNYPIERARLEVVLPGHIIGTLGFALYGWSVHYGWHLAVPEIALFLIGFGVSTAFNTSNTLLIDLHRDQPATATAATNLVRCLMSAAGAAAILPMCEVMGIGWAFMCVAGLYAIMILLLFLIMARGMRWRRVVEECV